jgi:hypothetical protein
MFTMEARVLSLLNRASKQIKQPTSQWLRRRAPAMCASPSQALSDVHMGITHAVRQVDDGRNGPQLPFHARQLTYLQLSRR